MIQRTACPVRCVTPDPSPDSLGAWHYFFGYYDKCPWNRSNDRMLAHRAGFLDRFPEPADACEVGVLDPESRAFTPLASTRAWNWQQGAQLQWIDWLGDPGDERVIFNDRLENDRLRARALRPDGSDAIEIDHPIYAVAPDGKTAVTLDFERLSHCRAEYGYAGLIDPHQTNPAPKHAGIYRIDLATGRRELLVSIAEVAAHKPSPMGEGRVHHVNHLMFNPSGTRFCFMHRFERADGITHSRLFTLGTDGTGLRLLFQGLVSHYDWKDDGTILAWAGRRKLLGAGGDGPTSSSRSLVRTGMTLARRTLKPIYYALGKPRWMMSRIVGDSYLWIPDAEEAEAPAFAKGDLDTDGHCTFFRTGLAPGTSPRWVLTDGYPDLKSRQPLFMYDLERGIAHEIGRYPTPRELDGPTRVDLHPRFDRTGARVCIDSAMDGSRRMYVVDVSSLVGPGVPARSARAAAPSSRGGDLNVVEQPSA